VKKINFCLLCLICLTLTACAKSSDVQIYTDSVCRIVSEHEDFGWGADFGLYDIDSDGIYEIILREGMHANLEVYMKDGTFLWKNTPEICDDFETKQAKTDNGYITLYFGTGGNSFTKIYTVEPINEDIHMCVYAETNAIGETKITTNIYKEEQLTESADGYSQCYFLYDKYFGKYEILSNDNILNLHKIEFDGMEKALLEDNMTAYKDNLYEAVSNAIKDLIK